MAKTALLIIDVQYGIFMRKYHDGMAIYNEDVFLENLKYLIEKARIAGVPIVYIQHLYENFPLMERGEPLWQIHPDIKPKPEDIVIEKRHADAFYETILNKKLKEMEISNLVITGLQTAYCVDTTCRRAFSLGYNNILVSDGHSTLNSDLLTAKQIIAHHNEVLGSQFAKIKTAKEIEF
jgi:nicotinamidase-related amidase